MTRLSPFQNRRAIRGIDLIEITIVLGIVGLVLGVIWTASAAMHLNAQVSTASQQLVSITQNVRAAFAEQGGVAGTAANLTPALDEMRVFPLEMRQSQSTPSGILFHPWSSQIAGGLGVVQVAADDCTGSENLATPQPCFGVTFTNVPQNACIQMVANTSGSHIGLQLILVNGVVAGDANAATLPILASTARANCNAAANTVLWVYLLRDNKS